MDCISPQGKGYYIELLTSLVKQATMMIEMCRASVTMTAPEFIGHLQCTYVERDNKYHSAIGSLVL